MYLFVHGPLCVSTHLCSPCVPLPWPHSPWSLMYFMWIYLSLIPRIIVRGDALCDLDGFSRYPKPNPKSPALPFDLPTTLSVDPLPPLPFTLYPALTSFTFYPSLLFTLYPLTFFPLHYPSPSLPFTLLCPLFTLLYPLFTLSLTFLYLGISFLYLTTIYVLHKVMASRQKFEIRLFSLLHNFNMFAISVICTLGLAYGTIRALYVRFISYTL